MTAKTLPSEGDIRNLARRLSDARRSAMPPTPDDLHTLQVVLVHDTLYRVYFAAVDREGFPLDPNRVSIVTDEEFAAIALRGLMALSVERRREIVTNSIVLSDLRAMLFNPELPETWYENAMRPYDTDRTLVIEARFRADLGRVTVAERERRTEPTPQLMALNHTGTQPPARSWEQTHRLKPEDFCRSTDAEAVAESLAKPMSLEFTWTAGPTLSVRIRHPWIQVGYSGTKCEGRLVHQGREIIATQTGGQLHFAFPTDAPLAEELAMRYECMAFAVEVAIPLQPEVTP